MLSKKVQMWIEEERLEREAEDKLRLGTSWADDAMEIQNGVEMPITLNVYKSDTRKL